MVKNLSHLAGEPPGQMVPANLNRYPYAPVMPAKTASPKKSEFIEIREAAEWLGVPFSSLRKYVARGMLPSYKIGRHRLFRKHELLEAIRETTQTTIDRILS